MQRTVTKAGNSGCSCKPRIKAAAGTAPTPDSILRNARHTLTHQQHSRQRPPRSGSPKPGDATPACHQSRRGVAPPSLCSSPSSSRGRSRCGASPFSVLRCRGASTSPLRRGALPPSPRPAKHGKTVTFSPVQPHRFDDEDESCCQMSRPKRTRFDQRRHFPLSAPSSRLILFAPSPPLVHHPLPCARW